MTERGQIAVTGINFRNSSLEIRSKLALTADNIKNIYNNIQPAYAEKFFILSTCNRTEIYCLADNTEVLLETLAQFKQVDAEEIKKYAFTKKGDEAIKHLFRVACGLDSQILGDYEIIGQLKNAFYLAKEYQMTSGLLEKLVSLSLQASKQVKHRTSLSNGTTSVSYAAIQLLRQTIGNDAPLNICLMGAGKIGTLTLKNLRDYMPQHRITILNRNESTAQEIAGLYDVNCSPFENQREVLKNSDVLIVATGADHSIIHKRDIADSRIKMIFDLSVPSNVSPEVKEISRIQLYNIDELSQIVNHTIKQRKNEVPLAEAIIDEHFDEFRQWETRRDLYSAKNVFDPLSSKALKTGNEEVTTPDNYLNYLTKESGTTDYKNSDSDKQAGNTTDSFSKN